MGGAAGLPPAFSNEAKPLNRNRLLIAALAVIALGALLLWQRQRLDQVQACVTQGGLWDGASSTCKPDPNRIIIQRDLQRS